MILRNKDAAWMAIGLFRVGKLYIAIARCFHPGSHKIPPASFLCEATTRSDATSVAISRVEAMCKDGWSVDTTGSYRDSFASMNPFAGLEPIANSSMAPLLRQDALRWAIEARVAHKARVAESEARAVRAEVEKANAEVVLERQRARQAKYQAEQVKKTEIVSDKGNNQASEIAPPGFDREFIRFKMLDLD